MTPSVSTLLGPRHGFRPAGFHPTPAAEPTMPAGATIPTPSTPTDRAQHVLMVEFTASDGRACRALGGGDTLADAIAFARDSCPARTNWQATDWNDLYGD